ncbi:succinate dehydrogenase, cytochrome b556 subunit [Salinibius halmophilus]|uniref:succinate dehydrogenase, cytochrome b556 subunit n=1 Tax=Salinibius halmophilus TaxID=1853216 RepID=UPI000E665CF4|nr:succinate dehydrogenase, cytochrome b556 subunit [Salinibius halmophilus]
MNNNRPVNLDLTTIWLPITGVVSFAHRVSGIVLFIGAAFLVWALDASLSSAAGFAQVKQLLAENFIAQFIVWGTLCALAYHFVAGIKHLIMDAGIGETKEGGKAGAYFTLIVSAVLFVLAGVWVW